MVVMVGVICDDMMGLVGNDMMGLMGNDMVSNGLIALVDCALRLPLM